MDKKFLIDTNIIIYYLKGEIPENHVGKVEGILEIPSKFQLLQKLNY